MTPLASSKESPTRLSPCWISWPTRTIRGVSLTDPAPIVLETNQAKTLQSVLHCGRFAPNGAALEVMEEFRIQNDPVRMWLDDRNAVLAGVPGTRMKRTEAYNNYSMWCLANGYKSKGSREFYNSLRREGIKEQNSNGERYFLEIVGRYISVEMPNGTVLTW